MPKHPGRTALYRLYDKAGHLLYVGVTSNPDARWKQHSAKKEWWPLVDKRTIAWHDTRVDAERVELAAIAAEEPRYNTVGTPAVKVTAVIGKAPTRPIRVDLADWGVFGEATNAMGTDRSAAFRAFMDWYLHKPGSKAPARPSKAVVEAAREAFLNKQAEKAAQEEGEQA